MVDVPAKLEADPAREPQDAARRAATPWVRENEARAIKAIQDYAGTTLTIKEVFVDATSWTYPQIDAMASYITTLFCEAE